MSIPDAPHARRGQVKIRVERGSAGEPVVTPGATCLC